MKLTEAKLKQLIRESMQHSEYYTKLKTLMTTEEGFLQAESLFEMIESILEPQERDWLKTYFGTIDLARELFTLKLQHNEAKEKYDQIEIKLIQGAPIDAEADKAYSETVRSSKAHYKKKKEFDQRMLAMLRLGDRGIYDTAKSMTRKILRGEI